MLENSPRPLKNLITRELVSIFAVMGAATMAMAILNPIMPLYLTSIGISPSLIGLMLAVAMVGMVFGESSGGWLADRVGLKIPMSLATFLCAPLVICFVFARNIPALFLIFTAWGFVRSGIFGPARGYIGRTATLTNKATIIAIYMTTLTFSRSIGTLVSGFTADRLGYDWDFYISVGLSVAAGILVMAGIKKISLKKTTLKSGLENIPLSLTPDRPDVKYRPVIIQSVLAMLIFMGIGVNSFLPLLATQYVGVDATKVGLLYTVGGLVSMALFIPLGRLADRRDKKTFIFLGLAFCAAGLAGMAFARSYGLLMALVIINNIGFTMFTPSAVALLSNNVPVYWQSTAMGIYGASEDLGIIIGSGVGGFVWSAGGPMWLYLMGSAGAVMGALICLGFVRDLSAKKVATV